MSSFKTAAQNRRHAETHCGMAELQSRATAASRMALRGDSYSHDDRMDCAADLVWRVLSDLPMPNDGRTGRPADVLAWIDGGYRAAVQRRSDVPAASATFTRLFGMASNFRRTIDRDRERDLAETLRAPVSFTPHMEMPADETGGTPWGARRSAVAMLRAVGMLGESEPVHWGPVWTLAYAAARAVASPDTAAEIDRDTVAAELELSPDTLRQHLSRAVGRIPAAATHGRPAWAHALGLPTVDGGIARKPSRSRTESADMGTRHSGPRAHLAHREHAPVTVRRDKRIVRSAPHGSDWGKRLARSIDGRDRRTAARLAAAAAIRMERSAARTDTERDQLRLAALAR